VSIIGRDLPPGLYVVLEVQDDGVGIEADNRAEIFEPFFTSKQGGRGLGLAAVLGIMRRMGGDIGVESALGAGSTFRLRFPAAGADTDAPAQEGPLPAPVVGALRVLVIDDEDHVRRAVHDMLDTRGMTILDAHSGEQGITIFRAEHRTIDLVILDLTMPGLSGAQTLEVLRTIDPDVRIVLTSGYSETRVEELVAETERTRFVRKPMSMMNLGTAIAALLSSEAARGG
jgi:CheY-like chemotaxis protein